MTARLPRLPEWEAMRRQLAIRRVVLQLTQTQAGSLAGTSKGAIANIEGGQRVPTVTTLIRLAEAYGLRVVLVPEEPTEPSRRTP